MKYNLKSVSISDLKSIRDYCIYQSEHRPFEYNKWANIAIITIAELETRIFSLFKIID